MSPRAALALAFLATASGLTLLERQSQSPSDELGSKLGQTDRQTFKVSEEDAQFGADAIEAEAAAKVAREAAAEASKKAAEEVGETISERELEAMDHTANVEAKTEYTQEQKMGLVVDTMSHEASADDRAVEDILRKARKVEAMDDARERKSRKRRKDDDDDDDDFFAPKSKEKEQKEREEATEARKAARDLREAERAVAQVKYREKNYLHKRGELEKETGQRLWREADVLRKDAIENGTLTEDEVLAVLDISKEALGKITGKILSIAHDDPGANVLFQDRIETVRFRAMTASAHLLEVVRHKTEEFKKIANDTEDKQILALISRLFNETRNEVRILQDTSQGIGKRIQGWDVMNPEKLSGTLSTTLDGVTGNIEFRHKLLGIDTERLARVNGTDDACYQLGQMLPSEIQPAYASLGHMKEALDSTAKVMPSLVKNLSFNAAALMDRPATILLDMAYVQHLALKEAANLLWTDTAPVIMDRLKCTLKSAAPIVEPPTGLVAFALVIWLAL